MVTLPFSVSHAVFDDAGHLVAFQRTLAPQWCGTGPTTTTSTTTPSVGPLQLGPGGSDGSRIEGSAEAVPNQSVLDRWSDGRATRLVGGVAAVAYVDSRS
jgi:hypothetical protein